jgi:hypothetical protein
MALPFGAPFPPIYGVGSTKKTFTSWGVNYQLPVIILMPERTIAIYKLGRAWVPLPTLLAKVSVTS